MVEKGIRSITCYAQANEEYMIDLKQKRIVISHVLGYEQSVWKDKVTKVACVWMQIETKKF